MIKRVLKNFLKKKGYVVTSPIKHNGAIDFKINEFYYQHISTLANYAPWQGDKDFLDAYSVMKNNTLVDILRSYEIWKLVEEAHKINPDKGVLEVGVWKGGTSALIARKMMLLGSKANIYMADTFEGVVKVSDKDDFYFGGEHSETNKDVVERLLEGKIKYPNYKILQGVFPDETGKLIPENETFALCHIDVDVYDSAKGVVEWIWEKLMVGGIIIFDDYGFHWCTGITKFVEEQQKLNDRIITYNLNGHAIMVKIK